MLLHTQIRLFTPFFNNWHFSDSISDARSVLDKELKICGTEEMNSFNCEQNSSTSKKQRNRTKNKRLQGYETSQGTVSIYCSVMVMLLHVFDTNTNSIIIMVLY